MTTATQPTTCKPNDHDFVPKRQEHNGAITNISEVFCRKCGTVCFLQSQSEPTDLIRRV